MEKVEIDSLVLKYFHTSDSDEKEGIISDILSNNSIGFLSILKSMSSEISSNQSMKRKSAILLLENLLMKNCKIIERGIESDLEKGTEKSLENLINFFLDKLKDWAAVGCSCNSLFYLFREYSSKISIMEISHLTEDDEVDRELGLLLDLPSKIVRSSFIIHRIVKRILLAVHAPSFGQGVRFSILRLLNFIIDNEKFRSSLVEFRLPLYQGVLLQSEDERDPRNLLLSFQCLQISISWKIVDENDRLWQEMFDFVTSYFPVKFRASPGDPDDISAAQLKEELNKTLYSLGVKTIDLLANQFLGNFSLDTLEDMVMFLKNFPEISDEKIEMVFQEILKNFASLKLSLPEPILDLTGFCISRNRLLIRKYLMTSEVEEASGLIYNSVPWIGSSDCLRDLLLISYSSGDLQNLMNILISCASENLEISSDFSEKLVEFLISNGKDEDVRIPKALILLMKFPRNSTLIKLVAELSRNRIVARQVDWLPVASAILNFHFEDSVGIFMEFSVDYKNYLERLLLLSLINSLVLNNRIPDAEIIFLKISESNSFSSEELKEMVKSTQTADWLINSFHSVVAEMSGFDSEVVCHLLNFASRNARNVLISEIVKNTRISLFAGISEKHFLEYFETHENENWQILFFKSIEIIAAFKSIIDFLPVSLFHEYFDLIKASEIDIWKTVVIFLARKEPEISFRLILESDFSDEKFFGIFPFSPNYFDSSFLLELYNRSNDAKLRLTCLSMVSEAERNSLVSKEELQQFVLHGIRNEYFHSYKLFMEIVSSGNLLDSDFLKVCTSEIIKSIKNRDERISHIHHILILQVMKILAHKQCVYENSMRIYLLDFLKISCSSTNRVIRSLAGSANVEWFCYQDDAKGDVDEVALDD